MSYMRGDYYIYRGKDLEISTPKGSTSMPMKIFDELIAMRWAQLPVSAKLRAEKRALENWYGNIGCDALAKKMGKKTIMEIAKEMAKKGAKK